MLLVGIWPLWGTLPEPRAGALTQAVQVGADELATPVQLPLRRSERGQAAHYRLSLQIDRDERPLYVFIPFVSQRATLYMEGRRIGDSGNRALMHGLASGTSLLALLPEDLLGTGSRVLDIHVEAVGLPRAYLSPLYVGTAEELAPYYRLSVFVFEYLRIGALAAQLLMAVFVLVIWLYRPGEPLFGWLTALLFMSMFAYVGLFGELVPQFAAPSAYAIMLGSSASVVMIIVSMLVSGRTPPRWLERAAVGLPAMSLLAAASGLALPEQVVLCVNAPLNALAVLASAAIISRAALAGQSHDARLLLLPVCLLAASVVHDVTVLAGWQDVPVFLSLYYRTLLTIGIAMVLMRRLGFSLKRLDEANDHLRRALQQREAELERLHEADRRKAAEQARHEERQRLIVDLHDGLSGHLVSIIAQSERQKLASIERTAREALDDLRLVIHSLDVEDRELRAALSGLRERLERQLRRIGVSLDWSTANLPEISGVTPTHALNILRIVQEALTNAINHGRARHVRVHGYAAPDGRACLSVENDGIPFREDLGGLGLLNMRRRVAQLGGNVLIDPTPSGTRLHLLLPLQLPPVCPQAQELRSPQVA
jgi:signal transduction histidine kinase